MTYSNSRFNPQRGSVLFFILIGVALFAALSYSVSSMMRGGNKIGDEKAGIYAAEILTYSRSIKEAVSMMQISNDCEDADISFANSIVAGYEHATAAKNGCKIFHSNGGGVSWIKVNSEVNDGSEWIFTGANDGSSIGTGCNNSSCSDLWAILPNIKYEICKSLNKRLGVATANDYMTQENDWFSVTKFIGIYSYDARINDTSGLYLNGKYSGCFEGKDAPQNSGQYYFYQVIIPR